MAKLFRNFYDRDTRVVARELVGKYLGGNTRKVMLVFSVLLLMMVGAVFVYSPAIILDGICNSGSFVGGKMFWIILIFIYYIIATLLPIDKIIGKIYPLFAFSLLFMAGALMIGLFIKWPTLFFPGISAAV